MRDPYSVLGVKKNADAEEIKTAWRRLAKAVHPDRNRDDPQAHARFAEAGAAYDMLKDPDRRSRYDREQAARAKHKEDNTIMARRAKAEKEKAEREKAEAERAEAEAKARRAAAEAERMGETSRDADNESAEDIVSRIFGGRKGAERNEQSDRTASSPDADDPSRNGENKGGGFAAAEIFASLLRKLAGVSTPPEKAPDLPVDLVVTLEDVFSRNKVLAQLPDGKATRVALPMGVVDGQIIRYPELGFRFPGMKRGDVLAKVRFERDELFQPDGHNLKTVLPVDIENAVLGCEATTDTPTGPIKVQVPPWSGSDRVLVLEGHGLPREDGSRGDLLIELRVMLWDHPDSKVTDLMRSMKEGLYI